MPSPSNVLEITLPVPIERKLVHDELEFAALCSALRTQGQKIVLTTGAFDILHEGHLMYLLEARKLGDLLIVGINCDSFVTKLKGPGKPVIPEKQRAFMIAGFACVDYAHIFEDRLKIVDLVRPQIFVMSDTSHAKPASRQHQQDLVRQHGGEIVIMGEMSSFHSTGILEKMRRKN